MVPINISWTVSWSEISARKVRDARTRIRCPVSALTSGNKYRGRFRNREFFPLAFGRLFPPDLRSTYVATCVCFSASPPDRQQQQPDRWRRAAEARVCVCAFVCVCVEMQRGEAFENNWITWGAKCVGPFFLKHLVFTLGFARRKSRGGRSSVVTRWSATAKTGKEFKYLWKTLSQFCPSSSRETAPVLPRLMMESDAAVTKMLTVQIQMIFDWHEGPMDKRMKTIILSVSLSLSTLTSQRRWARRHRAFIPQH